MQEKISSKNIESLQSYSILYESVETCPICKHAIKPYILNHAVHEDILNQKYFSILNLCKACYNTFISQYIFVALVKDGFFSTNFLYCAPEKFEQKQFDDLIVTTSQSFVKIYNEAFQAEHHKLNEIAGIGYRKALEFLIKDFLIKQNPDKTDEISKKPLMQCIDIYVNNPQLKTACSRAVWLGNDHTHYVQKFVDKDIEDLKRLIRLTEHWISMILETEEAGKIQPVK